ncbi:MAG: CoA pyrophosphatase [Marinosulfonomonas sp.]|nr:CoA pyrophosphatase [Marinosulfonomonas sp.]
MHPVQQTELWKRFCAAPDKVSRPTSDFELNKGVELPPGRVLRPAGVLIAVQETDTGLQMILTKRSSALKHHPGQVAFPGGKVDPADVDVVAAALREADEEIGLSPDNVEVVGVLPKHETITQFAITPVLARVKQAFVPRGEPGEVDEIFSVPLAHLADVSRYGVQSRHWRGVERYYYAVPYGPYYIWGATARMLHGLAIRMAP